MTSTPYGFRIVGACWEERRLVQAGAAFSAHAACDDRAEVDRESYLSAFHFGRDFRDLLESTGSCKGFGGACWSPWLWFDIDADDLDAAILDARRLASLVLERYRLDDDALLSFFSGSKGFHIGLPTGLWQPDASPAFHRIGRRFAENLAGLAAVRIDTGVYDAVRAFRAPNSKHPKTGLHKRRLTVEELMGLSLAGILDMAERPEPFELPGEPSLCDQARADWQAAVEAVERESEVKARRPGGGIEGRRLNRATLDFICNGAATGDRHRMLFSAAANLAEFGCPPALAHELLTDAALDSGLSPSEARRQIDCGLAHVGPMPEPAPAPPTASALPASDLADELAKLWQDAPKRAADLVEDNGARGDAWEPPADQMHPPAPPTGAVIVVRDEHGRCDRDMKGSPFAWTWIGCDRWFLASDWPIPFSSGRGAA